MQLWSQCGLKLVGADQVGPDYVQHCASYFLQVFPRDHLLTPILHKNQTIMLLKSQACASFTVGACQKLAEAKLCNNSAQADPRVSLYRAVGGNS